MRYVIQDLQEITDSREMLESRSYKFGFILNCIIFALIVTALTWSYFSEKEIVVKATGMVRPYGEIMKISNKTSGIISEVKFKDGDKIKDGDLIYTIEHGDLDFEKMSYEKKLEIKEKELENYNTLLKSI